MGGGRETGKLVHGTLNSETQSLTACDLARAAIRGPVIDTPLHLSAEPIAEVGFEEPKVRDATGVVRGPHPGVDGLEKFATRADVPDTAVLHRDASMVGEGGVVELWPDGILLRPPPPIRACSDLARRCDREFWHPLRVGRCHNRARVHVPPGGEASVIPEEVGRSQRCRTLVCNIYICLGRLSS